MLKSGKSNRGENGTGDEQISVNYRRKINLIKKDEKGPTIL